MPLRKSRIEGIEKRVRIVISCVQLYHFANGGNAQITRIETINNKSVNRRDYYLKNGNLKRETNVLKPEPSGIVCFKSRSR